MYNFIKFLGETILQKTTYENPLNVRYASYEMQHLFSPDTKFRTCEKHDRFGGQPRMELAAITPEQVAELKEYQMT